MIRRGWGVVHFRMPVLRYALMLNAVRELGRLAPDLARARARFISGDLDASAELSRQVHASIGGQAPLVRGDALAMPWREEFDVVTSFGAFGHIAEQDEPRLVANVHQVLKPGGRFVFVTGEEPSRRRPGYWVARAFNTAMRVRNALWEPPFVMYYLTFLLPRARALLEAQGFTVDVRSGTLPEPYERYGYRVVIATRR